MIRRLLLIAAWPLVGHMTLVGVYWGLLNVPESSPLMLAVSALLIIVIAIGAAASYTGALLAWESSRPVGRALLAGLRRFYWIVSAVLVFGAG